VFEPKNWPESEKLSGTFFPRLDICVESRFFTGTLHWHGAEYLDDDRSVCSIGALTIVVLRVEVTSSPLDMDIIVGSHVEGHWHKIVLHSRIDLNNVAALPSSECTTPRNQTDNLPNLQKMILTGHSSCGS